MPVTPSPAAVPVPSGHTRFRIFVDYWNLQLTLNVRDSASSGVQDSRFEIDFRSLPMCLVEEAAILVRATNHSYEGTMIFTSYNPKSPNDKKYHKWVTNWLDRQPGIQVRCSERRPKNPPTCPVCKKSIPTCPQSSCGANLAGTIEKGVDTAIVTNMIRLAWEQAYDVAILVSSDADLVPAVEFLDQRGFRIIQAGFPPLGSHLSRACWATIDLFAVRERFRRT
jgi:uncharacterized LabA/DUF88 family protein